MAEEEVKSTLRGLLLADPRFSWENCYTSGTTATQTGATADSPVRQSNEAARMDAADLQTGSVVAATRWLQTRKAGGHGYPNPARVTWSETDGGTERSWMSPAQCLDFFWVGYETAGANTFAAPAALGLADGSVLIVYRRSYVSGFERLCSVIIGAESVGYATSTEVIIAEDQVGSTMAGMAQLPSGRILLAYGSHVGWYSDDSGNTWVESPGNTGDGGSYRVSLAYHGGYLTMVGDGGDRCYSHTSSDQGGNWTPDVGSDGDYSSFGAFSGASCLGLPDGGCGLIYVDQADSCLKWAVKPAPNAPFDVDNAVTIYDGDTFKASVDKYQDYADVAACVGQDGLVCVAFRLHDPTSVNTHGCRVAVARFSPAIRPGTIAGGGTTWFHPDCIWDYDGAVQDGEALDWDARNERAEKMALAPRGGGYLLVTGFFATSGTLDGSIGAFVLGGWSSLQYVPATFGRYSDAVIYGRCYASFIIPALSGWTQTGAGMTVLTVDGVTCNTACNALYEGDNYGGQVFAVATVKVTAGAITAEDNYIRVVRTDGATYHYSVTLRLSSTGARLWDDNAGAAVGSDVSGLTASTHRQWLILNTGAVWVAYREQDDSEWVITHSVGTLTNDATPPALVNSVRFGDTTAAGIAHWRWVAAFASEDAVAQIELAPFLGATILKRGRPTSTRTQYLSSGLGFRSSGAPTFVGDQWQFPARYSMGLDALDPCVTASPSRVWRSTATTEQVYAWDLGADTSLMSPAVGMTVLNPLGRTWYLEGSTNGSAWTTLATLDAAEGMNGLTFTRNGDMVYQNAGSSASYACHADELVGGWAVLTSGGGTIYAARILGNTEGAWIGSGKPLHLRIELPASGSLPTSGTLAILWPAATRVAWAVTTQYRYWRVRVAAITLDATTSPQYLSASKVVIGPFIPFGQDPSWGRVPSMSPVQAVNTGKAGQRAVQSFARPRRAVEIQWTDANYAKSVFLNSPNWIAGAASAQPLAFAHDFRQVESLILRQSGAKYPVVYLSSVAYASGGTTLVGSERQLYGRILSDTVTRVATSGNEADNEAATIGAFRMEEEL